MAAQGDITNTQNGDTIPFPLRGSAHAQKRDSESQDYGNGASIALELSAILQSTLEWNKVLTLFNSEARQNVPFDALNYTFPSDNIHFEIGVTKHHKASYQLTLGNQTLGTITFSRRRPFSDGQLKLVEEMIVGLVYPLRNALLYRRAVQSAQRDPLTGIGNRAALETALKREIDLSHRNGSPLAMMVFDLDHFKNVNDTYGHAAGDCALKQFAQTVGKCARGTDMLFRFGGEEFVLLLNNTEMMGATQLGERIREAVEEMELECEGARFGITVSVGVAATRIDDTPESLFKRADFLLYSAKSGGRNCVCSAE